MLTSRAATTAYIAFIRRLMVKVDQHASASTQHKMSINSETTHVLTTSLWLEYVRVLYSLITISTHALRTLMASDIVVSRRRPCLERLGNSTSAAHVARNMSLMLQYPVKQCLTSSPQLTHGLRSRSMKLGSMA